MAELDRIFAELQRANDALSKGSPRIDAMAEVQGRHATEMSGLSLRCTELERDNRDHEARIRKLETSVTKFIAYAAMAAFVADKLLANVAPLLGQ